MSKSESDPAARARQRQKVLVGTLPGDFLRIGVPSAQTQETIDYRKSSNSASSNIAGRLHITVVGAKLVRNYGMTRMDPYVRLRVGHFLFETQSDPGGGKTPHWNRSVQCHLPKGVNIIYVEIIDECMFTADKRIAWSRITIPQEVFSGNTVEDWYPLSGKQGCSKEGMIDLVLSFTSGYYPYWNVSPTVLVPSTSPTIFGMPRYEPVSVYTEPSQPQLNIQILHQIQEMFPNIDKSIIKMIFEANGGNKVASVHSLLEMSE